MPGVRDPAQETVLMQTAGQLAKKHQAWLAAWVQLPRHHPNQPALCPASVLPNPVFAHQKRLPAVGMPGPVRV